MINRITDNQFKLVSKYQPSGDQTPSYRAVGR